MAPTGELVTFAPGQTSKTLAVGVKGDTAREGNEVLFVNLTQATGANLADAQGQGTILNDDGPVLAIGDVTPAEGQSGTRTANFRVTLTPASTSKVTVQYATANGTAQAGSDYVAKSGSLTFPAGQRVQTFSVVVRGDRVKEGNETFFVNLSGASGATVMDGRGVGPSRGGCGGSGCRRVIRRGGKNCRGWGDGGSLLSKKKAAEAGWGSIFTTAI